MGAHEQDINAQLIRMILYSVLDETPGWVGRTYV
jgi:hypothetical protein